MTRNTMIYTLIFAILISALSITNDIIRYILIYDKSSVIIYSFGIIPITLISTYSFIKFYPINSHKAELIIKRIFLVISIVLILLLVSSIGFYVGLNDFNSYR